jgi:hypothetical protein
MSLEGENEVKFSEEKIDTSKVSTISRGEQLIGNVNPSNIDEVATVKRACAYLVDVIEKNREEHTQNKTLTPNIEFLLNHAVGEILNAQMSVVKVLTYTNEEK